MDLSLSVAVVGLASSVLTELLKLFPFLKQNELMASVTAIVVTAIATYFSTAGDFTWPHFASVLLFAFLNYKIIVQPVAKALVSPTQ